MRAVMCTELGAPLTVGEVPDPQPQAGQVRVAVKAAGVNFPDTLIVQGKYQFKPDLPFSPGGEVAGVVDAIGPDVQGVKVGDRVIAFTVYGGFAEAVCVDARALVPMPDDLDFVTAGGLVLAYGTTIHALSDRARLKEGETLLVLGAAGGVGLSAVEIGKAMGARVIAAASSPEKLATCTEHGADETIDYSKEDLKARVKELTGGNGADVIYDPVGGDFAEPALRSIAWEGRYLVVGFAAGEIPEIPLNLALLKGCQIVGVFWGAFAARDPKGNASNIAKLLGWVRDGTIKPLVSATYPLEEATEALRQISERRAQGKIVLTV
ncbi:MAG: NADPH:quinone oxidoreductase family protein [Actinomycetota bacterium]